LRSTPQAPIASSAASFVRSVFAVMNTTGIAAVAALLRKDVNVAGPSSSGINTSAVPAWSGRYAR